MKSWMMLASHLLYGALAGGNYELQSDWLGVCLMERSGYDPNEMITVMHILESATQGARPPEFFSTHPNPDNRIGRIQAAIDNIENCP